MEFVCHVGTPDGRVRRESRSAPDERALRPELDREGLALLGIERARAGRLRPAWLAPRPRRVKLPDLLVFNQELAALLKAGLPLLQALQLLADRQREPHFRAILGQVRERVKSGVELSEAFGEFGDAFPLLYASSLKAGERTGELEQVVRRFVRYLKGYDGALGDYNMGTIPNLIYIHNQFARGREWTRWAESDFFVHERYDDLNGNAQPNSGEGLLLAAL